SPGAALEIYGANLTPGSTLVSDALDWRYRLAGARVRVGGRNAPLYYASPTQLNVQFPTELSVGGMADVVISVGDRTLAAGQVPVAPAPPVIRAAVARMGFAEIYVTGLGATEEAIGTGTPAPIDRLVRTRSTPAVRIGGREATLQFSG